MTNRPGSGFGPIAGERDAATLAELAQGRMRPKHAQLREALTGRLTEHHHFLLASLLRQVEFFDRETTEYDRHLEEKMPPFAASWAAICPGNNHSAGKRRSGRMRIRLPAADRSHRRAPLVRVVGQPEAERPRRTLGNAGDTRG